MTGDGMTAMGCATGENYVDERLRAGTKANSGDGEVAEGEELLRVSYRISGLILGAGTGSRHRDRR